MRKSILFTMIIVIIITCCYCVSDFEYYDIANSSESLKNNSLQDNSKIKDINNESNLNSLDIVINKININDIENGKTYQIIEYPELSCSNNDYINAELSLLTTKLKTEVTNFKNENKDIIREMINTADEDSIFNEMQYSYVKEAEVVTNDNNYLSLLISTYMYAGGAHPSYIINGYTYDVAKNKETDLYDFINDKEELRKFLKDYVNKHKDDMYEDADKTIDNYIDNPSNEYGIDYHIDYYIENRILHVVFQSYELAPYAVGIIDIELDKRLLKVEI